MSLGHPNNKLLEKVLQSCNVKVSHIDTFNFYEAGQYGKINLLPFETSSSYTHEILELVNTDECGTTIIISSSGFKYYVHFIDNFIRFT